MESSVWPLTEDEPFKLLLGVYASPKHCDGRHAGERERIRTASPLTKPISAPYCPRLHTCRRRPAFPMAAHLTGEPARGGIVPKVQ